jgi:hypothetical protein
MTQRMACLRRTFRAVRGSGSAGMTTAEYAVGTLAAVAFAAVLLAVVKSGPVKSALAGVITSALGIGS